MTSQLNVDTIVDKAGSGGTNVKMANTSTYVSDGGAVTQNTVQGLIKGRLHIDQTSSNAVRDSFNMSFVTDEGAGEAMVGITNPMSDSTYVIHVTGSTNRLGSLDTSTAATNQYSIEFIEDSTGNKVDSQHGMTSFQGDLA
jgi:hypothetical protein